MLNIYEVVEAYEKIRLSIKARIKASNYKLDYFASQLGIAKSAFYKRLREANWEPAHLLQLAELLGIERPAPAA